MNEYALECSCMGWRHFSISHLTVCRLRQRKPTRLNWRSLNRSQTTYWGWLLLITIHINKSYKPSLSSPFICFTVIKFFCTHLYAHVYIALLSLFMLFFSNLCPIIPKVQDYLNLLPMKPESALRLHKKQVQQQGSVCQTCAAGITNSWWAPSMNL